MKPRTKLQFRVMELSSYLPKIENKILEWAKVDCLEHKGYATKSRVICMDCGERFSPELVSRKRAICPYCDTKLKIEVSKCRTDKQHLYVAIADAYGEFQIIRNFEIWAHYKDGEASRYFIQEILQHWIVPGGKHTIVGKNHTTNWYCDSWNGDMEIRNEYRSNYYSTGVKYDIYPHKLHPDSIFLNEITKHGIDHRLQGITPLEAIQDVPKNPKMETLLKAKRYELLEYFQGNKYKAEQYWTPMKICIRNKYTIKDVKIWIDYLDLLSYFRKDLHNAHYVCPKDLKKAHDEWMKKKRLVEMRKAEELKRLKAIEDEAKFKKLKAKFFGIAFSDGELQVKVLESIEEFMNEGDTLHHCVFTNEYYLKPHSLILSARIGEKRIETIELNLKTLNVIQSRGACNQNTEYHDRIIGLVKKNIGLIRQRVAV